MQKKELIWNGFHSIFPAGGAFARSSHSFALTHFMAPLCALQMRWLCGPPKCEKCNYKNEEKKRPPSKDRSRTAQTVTRSTTWVAKTQNTKRMLSSILIANKISNTCIYVCDWTIAIGNCSCFFSSSLWAVRLRHLRLAYFRHIRGKCMHAYALHGLFIEFMLIFLFACKH